jgi:hypothetical protein
MQLLVDMGDCLRVEARHGAFLLRLGSLSRDEAQ